MPFVTYLGRKLVSSTARKAEDTNSKDLVVKRSTGCESDAPGEVRLYELRLRRRQEDFWRFYRGEGVDASVSFLPSR